ncbi:MAG: hypothetical protein M1838_003924 [Thelocarpon superellum]|nr:MAG: hypothetical protein M1838_003924 [Thelocarpon superellum]
MTDSSSVVSPATSTTITTTTAPVATRSKSSATAPSTSSNRRPGLSFSSTSPSSSVATTATTILPPSRPSRPPSAGTPSHGALPPSAAAAAANLTRTSLSTRSSHSSSRIGLSGLAALARDKTSSTIHNFANKPWSSSASSTYSTEHQSDSTGALVDPAFATSVEARGTREIPRSHPGLEHRAQPLDHLSHASTPRAHSRASSAVNSRASSPVPAAPGSYNKMHQTSSRLLRMTEEERPFTRDFKDLFSTLMVSLPLIAHRVRFQKVEHTFTSEEAINNLGSLKFSQSNRMPDPKDPSRIVTTTTTTTFSMAREMARSVCQRFMDGRFIESADGKHAATFPLKNGVWQLTPKGMHVLSRFCQRNGITQKHVLDLLESPRNCMQLVLLERDLSTDRLSHDKATTEVIFRRFVGPDGPNTKNSIATADSDSVSDYYNGMIGVKMARERKVFEKTVRNTFTGKAAVDWLMDCSTTVDRKEACETAGQFVKDGLMYPVTDDKAYIREHPKETSFQPTKNSIYTLTNKGQRVAGWILREKLGDSDDDDSRKGDAKSSRDSNNNRLAAILADPALRLLFREFLRDTHCEENLAFYLDVVEFTTGYREGIRKMPNPKIDTIRETLAAAYGLYNAFLAPGSPCELNIDHNLRNNLASRMTRAVGDDQAMIDSLNEVARLFDEAQNSVFKLMSSDSVPKFLKDPKYSDILREHDLENATNGLHKTIALPGRKSSKLGR